MNKKEKVRWGFLTFSPLVLCLLIFIILIPLEYLVWKSVEKFAIALLCLQFLWTFVLLMIFYIDLYQQKRIATWKKLIWAILFFPTNIISMPIYWYFYVWQEHEESSEKRVFLVLEQQVGKITKNQIYGFLIVVVILLMYSGISELEWFFNFQAIVWVLAFSGGLTLMYYKKGIEKTKLLRRMKKYLIFSGYLGMLIVLMNFAVSGEIDRLTTQEIVQTVASSLQTVFLGYLFSYILDTFLPDE